MGYLRFFLALCVVQTHSSYFLTGIGGSGAVQAFFVLSGMYMAAVYQTKYSLLNNGAWLFYLNRFLRLYPTYLFLLAFTALCYLAASMNGGGYFSGLFDLFSKSQDLPYAQKWAVWISTFTLFGQDFQSLSVDLHYMLPVRQSWSIATELLFYLTVPMLFRFMTWQRALVGAGIFAAIKIALFLHGGYRWSYFLPIGNFCYFLFGYALHGLSIHPNVETLKARFSRHRVAIIVVLCLPLIRLGESSFEEVPFSHIIAMPCIAGLCLMLFKKSPNKVDYFLGNISYGVYLNHLLLVALGRAMGLHNGSLALLVVPASLILAFLMEKTLQEPIDRYRRGFTTLPAPVENR